jgi:non-heme chloroperoxidase
MPLKVQAAELPGGITLPYVEQGSGTPIVMLHGITDSWRSFELLLPHLPESVRAIAITQRGHGDASKPESGYYPTDFARDLAAFLDVLNIPAAFIVGHSMGSYIAQRFALDNPARTLGLVLIGSMPTCRGNVAVESYWEEVVQHLEDPIPPSVAIEFQESTLAHPIPPWYMDAVVQESLKVPAHVWRAAFKALVEDDHSGHLPALRALVLSLGADGDAFFPPPEQEKLRALLPNAEFRMFEGVGHAIHWEQPGRVATEITEFVARLAKQRGTAA